MKSNPTQDDVMDMLEEERRASGCGMMRHISTVDAWRPEQTVAIGARAAARSGG
jgi:hypothetical protein